MSDFMFGGSALTLDISAVNKSGGAVKNGDILQISLLNSDGADGRIAVTPVLSNGGISQLAPMGVVQAPTGLEISNGDSCILRMVGRCDVLGQASTTYTQDEVVQAKTAVKTLDATKVTLNTSGFQQQITLGRLRGVVLTTVTTTTKGELVDCWISGLP
jgi:hypothetical protein